MRANKNVPKMGLLFLVFYSNFILRWRKVFLVLGAGGFGLGEWVCQISPPSPVNKHIPVRARGGGTGESRPPAPPPPPHPTQPQGCG